MSGAITLPSYEDLAAENARLREALGRAGHDAQQAEARSTRRESAARADTRLIRADLAVSERLVADLRAAQAAARISEERLALAFEASGSLGWWDWDIPADRLYAGPVFARMFGVDPALAAAGVPLAAFEAGIHPDDRGRIGERIRQVVAAAADFDEEYRLQHADGTVSWIHARGRCYHDEAGRPLRYPGVALDVTAAKRGERRRDALMALGDRLRDLGEVGPIAHAGAEVMAQALDAGRAGFGLVDQTHGTVVVQPDWCRPGMVSVAGPHRFRDYGSFVDDLARGELVVVGDAGTDPRTDAAALRGIGVRALVNVPIVERGRLVAVVFVHDDRPQRWDPGDLRFIRTVADRIQAAVARARAEERQSVLNHELSHRLKNTLALVQSVAAQTLRNAPTLAEAGAALATRLVALGKAHDILLSGDIAGADVAALVAGALALHDGGPGRFRLDGPALEIGPSAALSLALILHELATNAAKYGALSVPHGTVTVSWAVGPAPDPAFRLTWTEAGGPPVAPPRRKGFGSRLIGRGLAGGGVALRYPPEGVVCTLTAPLAGLRSET
ncbi:sensor histidine kinase [Methylobacterium oryzihabitans]|uniref:sensor histidine kinase n=1 Tax=Methylobacterium oryzihabitans TaxID=2499852 RepID=UPI0016521B9C|nr:HWE histidine kinase domain-containing protein [Methylobacterium oryzihabitans]